MKKLSLYNQLQFSTLNQPCKDIETYFSSVSSTLTPEYHSTVDKIGKKSVTEIVNVHCKNLVVKQYIEGISTSIQMNVSKKTEDEFDKL